MSASKPHISTVASRPRDVDATVTAWATDLTGARSQTSAITRLTGDASGFVDFDVVDTIHAAARTASRAVER